MATIQIQRAGFNREPWTEDIEADVYGVFAVHPEPGVACADDDDFYNLTHIPTGYAYLTGTTKAKSEAAAKELNADASVDWSAVKAVADLTDAHKKQGRVIRAKYNRG